MDRRSSRLEEAGSIEGDVMDISGINNAINRVAQALPSTANTIAPDKSVQNREVVQAVKALNQTEMFGEENELQFQRDQDSKRLVLRIVNRKTQEVIAQVPPEYVLALADAYKK
jgi:uncharacterized FlaG/YvyC family protein